MFDPVSDYAAMEEREARAGQREADAAHRDEERFDAYKLRKARFIADHPELTPEIYDRLAELVWDAMVDTAETALAAAGVEVDDG